MLKDKGDEPGKGQTAATAHSFLARSLDFLGMERNVLIMIAALMMQALGAGLWEPFRSKVLEVLGASGKQIGIIGTIGVLMTAVAPYLGGVLSDRLGRGRQLILACAMAVAGYVIYAAAPVWWVFIPGAVLLATADSFRFMGSLALIGDRLPQNRRAIGIAMQNVLVRSPRAVGHVLGGQLIAWLGVVFAAASAGLLWGFRAAVVITIFLTLVGIFVQRRYYRLPPPGGDKGFPHALAAFRAMSGELKRFLLADCLIRFGNRMFLMFVVLYAMNEMGVGPGEFGLLSGLMVATSVSMYIPAAKLSDRGGRRGRRPFIAATFFFFAAFPLTLVWAPSAAWLIGVFVIGGLREFGEPARKALIIDLIPPARRGQQMGTYYMLRGVSTLAAPLIGGTLWDWNPQTPFLVGGLITAAGLAWFLLESVLFHGKAESV